jgi:hypothetical protein
VGESVEEQEEIIVLARSEGSDTLPDLIRNR